MSSGSEQSSENDDMNRTVMMMDPEFSHRGCCFFMPRFNCWERMRGGAASATSDESGWAVRSWKKVREWSEIAAGPRWKTFIRKFGRKGNAGAAAGQGRFGYDELSYALNFDDGQNVQTGEVVGNRDFSTRFAPVSAKSSMDFGRDGPSFT